MNMKTCSKCHVDKDDVDFRYRRTACVECERKYARERARLPDIVERSKRWWVEHHSDQEWLDNNLKKRRERYRKNPQKDIARVRKYQLEHIEEIKARHKELFMQKLHIILYIKSITPCADCHKIFPTQSMDFDHARGSKIDDISRMIRRTYSVDSLLAEIEKCDVVCANCHRMRTTQRPRKWTIGKKNV